MTTALESVEAAALELSTSERAELIERLIDTVLPPPPLHPAWEAEIGRRVAEMDAGLVESLELIAATRWYLDDGGPAVAERFEAAIARALGLLDLMPQLGSPSFPGMRTWALKLSYSLVYRVQGEVMSQRPPRHAASPAAESTASAHSPPCDTASPPKKSLPRSRARNSGFTPSSTAGVSAPSSAAIAADARGHRRRSRRATSRSVTAKATAGNSTISAEKGTAHGQPPLLPRPAAWACSSTATSPIVSDTNIAAL